MRRLLVDARKWNARPHTGKSNRSERSSAHPMPPAAHNDCVGSPPAHAHTLPTHAGHTLSTHVCTQQVTSDQTTLPPAAIINPTNPIPTLTNTTQHHPTQPIVLQKDNKRPENDAGPSSEWWTGLFVGEDTFDKSAVQSRAVCPCSSPFQQSHTITQPRAIL